MSVLGYDPQNSGREFRDRIGIVLQTSGIEAELTVDLIGLVDSADCDRGDDGVVAYDLDVAVSNLPAATVSLLVGVACFATLGLALAALAPSGTAAPAIANATLLPLAFISNIFVPLEDPPMWLGTLGNVFPLRRFANAFSAPFNPFTEGGGWQISDLAVLVVGGMIGLGVTLKFFRWKPHPEATTRRRRRANAAVTAR